MRIVIMVLIFCFIGCTTDIESPLKFPIVVTDEPSVDLTGAQFAGHLSSNPGNQEIINYGFVWGGDRNPTLQSFHVIINGPTDEEFSKIVTRDLPRGPTFVKAFVQTNELTIYGNSVRFESLGNIPPYIKSFTPLEGFDGTEVTLLMGNYSYKTSDEITIGSLDQCEILSATDTTIKIKTPSGFLIGPYPFVLHSTGGDRMSDETFKILGPTIISLPRNTVKVYEKIVLTCEYLDKAGQIELYFEDQNSPNDFFFDIKVLSPTQLEVKIPNTPDRTGRLKLVASYPHRKTSYAPGFLTITN